MLPRASKVSRRSTTSRSHSSSDSLRPRSTVRPTPIGRPRNRREVERLPLSSACAARSTSRESIPTSLPIA
jgi:hypothetical protein